MSDSDSALAKLESFGKRLGGVSRNPVLWRDVRDEFAEFLKSVSPVGKAEPKLRDAMRWFLHGLTMELHMARQDLSAWETFQWLQDTSDPDINFAHGDPRYPWSFDPVIGDSREPDFYWLAARVALCAEHYDIAIAACERAIRGKLILLDVYDIAVLALWRSGAKDVAEKMYNKALEALMRDGHLERPAGLERMWRALRAEATAREHKGSLPVPATGNMFIRQGSLWQVSYEGETKSVRALKGMNYLAVLLANPGKPFHVMELSKMEHHPGDQWAGATGGDIDINAREDLGSRGLGNAGDRVDPEALRGYKAEALRLAEEVKAARERNDPAEEQKLLKKLAELKKYGDSAKWGGEIKKESDIVEKVRSAVRQAVQSAIQEIGTVLPKLGEHLKSVQNRTICSYTPQGDVTWDVRP